MAWLLIRRRLVQHSARRHRQHHRCGSASKTTLFRMITGREQPDKELSNSAKPFLSYRPKPRRSTTRKTSGKKCPEGRTSCGSAVRKFLRAYVGRFNFRGADQRKVGDLSGGERNQLHLAKLCDEKRAAARRPNAPRRRNAARARRRARFWDDRDFTRSLVSRPVATHMLVRGRQSHQWFANFGRRGIYKNTRRGCQQAQTDRYKKSVATLPAIASDDVMASLRAKPTRCLQVRP